MRTMAYEVVGDVQVVVHKAVTRTRRNGRSS
jgi:hypothetical protein